ncbi:hypothetical protein NFG57_13720 [Halomonas sp. H10-59]|uniref:Uncharacterized protein n=1 Tax=Halomonas sp. H10-59 TaxID=2950874 RepID=A0AAU7KSA0_9GAMM
MIVTDSWFDYLVITGELPPDPYIATRRDTPHFNNQDSPMVSPARRCPCPGPEMTVTTPFDDSLEPRASQFSSVGMDGMELLEQELEHLRARHLKLREEVAAIRHYAGDNLPAKAGLVIVKMLEDALKS